MSITLDGNTLDVFKLYDELAISYSKDIDGYKALIKAVEAMLAQKEDMLRDIKNKTIHLIKESILSPDIITSYDASLDQLDQSDKKFNYAGVNEEDLKSGKGIELENAVFGMPYANPGEENIQDLAGLIQESKSRRTHHKKATGTVKKKVKRAEKPKKTALRSNKIAVERKGNQLDTTLQKSSKAKSTKAITEIKCLYHPESLALDKGRQLCSSCKWKLINSGLIKFDKAPEVISFLKGETSKIPIMGQSMCPVHPEVPSYNRKTGLCKECQKKAKTIGIQDRHLTEEELELLRNPSL